METTEERPTPGQRSLIPIVHHLHQRPANPGWDKELHLRRRPFYHSPSANFQDNRAGFMLFSCGVCCCSTVKIISHTPTGSRTQPSMSCNYWMPEANQRRGFVSASGNCLLVFNDIGKHCVQHWINDDGDTMMMNYLY